MKHKKRKPVAFLLAAIAAISLLTGNIQTFAAFPVSTEAQSGEISITQDDEIPDTENKNPVVPDTQEPEASDTQNTEAPGTQDSEISGTQEDGTPDTPDSVTPGAQEDGLSGKPENTAPDSTLSHTKAASKTQHGVTFETTQDYVHSIYANGEPLLVVASETNIQYSKLYVDSNRNGVTEP